MALGNLSVKVTADVGDYTFAMNGIALTAKERMGQSAQAVDRFRDHVQQSAVDIQHASDKISNGMAAANDEIIKGSAESVAAIESISEAADKTNLKSLSEKIATAIGNGIGAGMVAAQTAFAGFVEYTKTKAIIASVAIAALFTAVGLGAAYTAYRVISASSAAIKGMLDGSFFKSENIDNAIAANDAIKALQQSLHISVTEAGALHDAFGRLGVPASDYQAAYDGVAKAIVSNVDELDRLGVAYKDSKGKILEHSEILRNAKTELDSYREGSNRAAAAAAIGMGTYEQITNALKVNADEVGKSADRLNEYGLGMSKFGQDSLTAYQTTMREFDHENKLFADGFKRVYSDAILPAYTSIASVFKDGMPILVQAFRVAMSSIVALAYGAADGIYIAYRSITGALGVLQTAVNAVSNAVSSLAKGDFKGAGDAIANAWTSAKSQVKVAGKDMVDVILENDKRIKLAVGSDGRNMPIGLAKGLPKAGKVFAPKPEDAAAAAGKGEKDDPAKKIFEGYLKAQDALVAEEKTMLQAREQFMQAYLHQEYITKADFERRKQDLTAVALKAELEAYDREIAAAIVFRKTRDKEQDRVEVDNKIAEIQKKKATATAEANKVIGLSVVELSGIYRRFDLESKELVRLRDIENSTAAFNIDMMGRNTLEVLKLTEARRMDLEVQERIRKLRKEDAGADASGEVTRALEDAERQKAIASKLIQDGWDKQRTAAFGAAEAVRKYGEDAANIGAQVQNAMTNAFQGMEDALVKFVTTGKLSFKDLANSIVADITRMIIKEQMSKVLSSMGGGIGGLFGSLFGGPAAAASTAAPGIGDGAAIANFMSGLGFANGGDPPVGMASMVGENGPELFVPKTAGTIIPNSALQGKGDDKSQSNVFHFNFSVPANMSRDSQKQLAQMAGMATQRAIRSNG